MADKSKTEDVKQAAERPKERYRVLCWGACEGDPNNPCTLYYPVASGERHVTEGHIAHGIPEQSIRHELKAGHIAIELVEDEPKNRAENKAPSNAGSASSKEAP